MKLATGLLIACLLVGVGAGCGRNGAGKAEEKPTTTSGADAEIDLDVDSGTFRIESKEGTISMAGGRVVKVPDDFPSDVPIYKGAKPLMSAVMPEGVTLTLSTPDDVATVSDTYRKALMSEGWEAGTSMDLGAQKISQFNKGDRVATVTASESDGQTIIGLVVATQ